MYELEVLTVNDDNLSETINVGEYDSVEEAIAFPLSCWWEEPDGPHLYHVREGRRLHAVLMSAGPVITASRMSGEVVVNVVRANGTWETRVYHVTYFLTVDGEYKETRVECLSSDRFNELKKVHGQ